MSALCDQMRKLRDERGWTQQEVADRLKVNKQTISQYERGVREPHIDMLCAIADLYQISVDELVGHGTPSPAHPVSVNPSLSQEHPALALKPEEWTMIQLYRSAPDDKQQLLSTLFSTAVWLSA